jgi:hypothetical protein
MRFKGRVGKRMASRKKKVRSWGGDFRDFRDFRDFGG